MKLKPVSKVISKGVYGIQSHTLQLMMEDFAKRGMPELRGKFFTIILCGPDLAS